MDAPEVDVPKIGRVQRGYVYGGLGLVAGVVVYAYWRQRSDASSAAAAAAAATTTSGTSQQAVTEQTPNAGVGSLNNSAYPGTGSTDGGQQMPTTDQEWTALVVEDLENLGTDPTTVTSAVALYLDSQPLTTAQAGIIMEAWAYCGRPPEHPTLPIIYATSSTPPPSGGGTTTPPPSGGGTTTPPPSGGKTPAPPPIRWHTNVAGDSYSKIAQEYGVLGGNGVSLYDYQLQPGVRPSTTQAELRKSPYGPPTYRLFAGGKTAIPPA